MITTISELDIELLYYLDIESVINVCCISKFEYNIISDLDFYKQLLSLKTKSIDNIIYAAAQHNYVSLIEWISKSINKFHYSSNIIDNACKHGNIDVLEWFAKSNYKFEYTEHAIIQAAANGARRRSR